jgi:hypothetical protein
MVGGWCHRQDCPGEEERGRGEETHLVAEQIGGALLDAEEGATALLPAHGRHLDTIVAVVELTQARLEHDLGLSWRVRVRVVQSGEYRADATAHRTPHTAHNAHATSVPRCSGNRVR